MITLSRYMVGSKAQRYQTVLVRNHREYKGQWIQMMEMIQYTPMWPVQQHSMLSYKYHCHIALSETWQPLTFITVQFYRTA